MRELSAHKLNECNEAIRIEVLDGPGPGGANHEYEVLVGADDPIGVYASLAYRAYGETTGFKNFQGNPMPEWEALPPAIRMAWCAATAAVKSDTARTRLSFQNGAVLEVGTNGITHEALLAVLIDRLQGFQSGPYACPENGLALGCLQNALYALQSRTRARIDRGVEGTMEL